MVLSNIKSNIIYFTTWVSTCETEIMFTPLFSVNFQNPQETKCISIIMRCYHLFIAKNIKREIFVNGNFNITNEIVVKM